MGRKRNRKEPGMKKKSTILKTVIKSSLEAMGKSTANHTAMTLWSRAWKVMLKKKKSIWT